MTDREKLIELLGLCERCNAEYCNQCEFGQDIDGCVLRQKEIIADTLLANGVTFATDTNVGGKWIPVTERLPEETRVPKDVLVYHKLGNCGICVDRAWYDSDKNKWRSALSMNMKVTHWMPMPEPPVGNPSVSLEADSSLCTREPLNADI